MTGQHLDLSRRLRESGHGWDGRPVLDCLRAEPAIVAVRGVANNPFYAQPIKDLTLTLYGVRRAGRHRVAGARGPRKHS